MSMNDSVNKPTGDCAYSLFHNRHDRRIAYIVQHSAENGGWTVRIETSTKELGNLAQEWVIREMDKQGQAVDHAAYHADYPKWCRCRSRKRLIKLLMAEGFPKRFVQLWISTVREIKGPTSYQTMWLDWVFAHCYTKPD